MRFRFLIGLCISFQTSFVLAQVHVSPEAASALVVLQVQDLQSMTQQVVVRSAVGAVINPEGFVVSSSVPFQSTEKGGVKTIRTEIRGATIQGGDREEPFELLYVDESRGVALLKPRKELSKRPHLQIVDYPGAIGRKATVVSVDLDSRAIFTREVSITKDQSERQTDEGSLRGVVTLKDRKILPGSPVLDSNSRLVGVIPEVDDGWEFRMVSIGMVAPALAIARIDNPQTATAPFPSTRVDFFRINETLSKHVGGESIVPYERVYQAPAGYKIAGTTVFTGSANGVAAAPFVKLSGDERTATVRFALKSGPIWDQRRGWFNGEVRVELVPEEFRRP